MIVKTMAILLALAIAAIGIQQWRVSHYKARAESLQSVANTLHDANVANQATIVALKAANAEWADKCRADEPLARSEAEKAIQYESRQHVAVAQSIAAMKVTYEHDPTVKAWASVALPDAAVRVLEASDPD